MGWQVKSIRQQPGLELSTCAEDSHAVRTLLQFSQSAGRVVPGATKDVIRGDFTPGRDFR